MATKNNYSIVYFWDFVIQKVLKDRSVITTGLVILLETIIIPLTTSVPHHIETSQLI